MSTTHDGDGSGTSLAPQSADKGAQEIVSSPLVDIGINLTHRALTKHWEEVVQRAVNAGVSRMLLTGTSMKSSLQNLELAKEWHEQHGEKNLLCTVGIHPHDAKTFRPKPPAEEAGSHKDLDSDTEDTINEMRSIISRHPLVVAVGECGLDYNRNFSSKSDQLHAFREQVKLAAELDMPLFVHEREAHDDLVRVLDEVEADKTLPSLPPVVVHCFTGTHEEAQAYLKRGYYIGFTGTICKKERGASLRALLPEIPLERIMVETDAPFMAFIRGKRRHSEPAHVVEVAKEISRTMGFPFQQVCSTTTQTARKFFRFDKID